MIKYVCRRCSGYGVVTDELLTHRVPCPDCTLSGTPALTPGVLEDGGSVAVGESSPPAPDAPMADPPSPPVVDDDPPSGLLYMAWVVIANAPGWETDSEWRQAAIRWRDEFHAALSLTDGMRVERCRALLERWRKDRLDYPKGTPHGYAAYVAVKACEDELREALGDPS